MDLQEIIARPVQAVFTVEELSYVVQEYIKAKKNREITINLKKGLEHLPQQFQTAMYGGQVSKLHKAFDVAKAHFINN